MTKSIKDRFLRTDPAAYERLVKLTNLTKAEQGVSKLGMNEITRRMINTNSFLSVEKEILEDARLKKELKKRRII